MKPIERLREIVDFLKKEHGLTNELISRSLDYRSASYISDILGESKPINSLFLDRLKEKYGIQPEYINTGKGDKIDPNFRQQMNEDEVDYTTERLNQKLKVSTYMVPLVPIKAQAGYLESYMMDEFIEKLDKFPMAPGINPRGAEWRWFEVQGESMEPTLYEGDYILCSMVNQEDWSNLENYYMYVIVTAGESRGMWVKRIVRRGSHAISMHSDNKKVKPRIIELTEVREIWKVRRHLNARMPPPEKIKIDD